MRRSWAPTATLYTLALLSSALHADSDSAQELAEKLAPLYEAKAYSYEELARVQTNLSKMLDDLIEDFQNRQKNLQKLAGDLSDLNQSHLQLVEALQSAKSWKDLGKAFSASLEDLPDPQQRAAYAPIAEQFAKANSSLEFAQALQAKFSFLASQAKGAAQRAYQKTADALKKATADNADETITESLADYYDSKEVESSALQKAHTKAAKELKS